MLQDAFRDVLNEAPRALHNSDVNFIYGTSNLRKKLSKEIYCYIVLDGFGVLECSRIVGGSHLHTRVLVAYLLQSNCTSKGVEVTQ